MTTMLMVATFFFSLFLNVLNLHYSNLVLCLLLFGQKTITVFKSTS